jgi:hypothetical protein
MANNEQNSRKEAEDFIKRNPVKPVGPPVTPEEAERIIKKGKPKS